MIIKSKVQIMIFYPKYYIYNLMLKRLFLKFKIILCKKYYLDIYEKSLFKITN